MIEITSESAIQHLLENVPHQVKHVWLPESDTPRLKNLATLAKAHRIPIEKGAVQARVTPPEFQSLESIFQKKPKLLVGLDHIQDPQNFGAICRSAEAMGVGAVIFPKDRSVTLGPGTYAASVGAIGTLPLVPVSNLRDAMKKAKAENYWVMGATRHEEAISLPELQDYDKSFLILGSEWEGLGQHVQKDCDLLVSIPHVGKIESLNVSAAAAVLIYAILTKRSLSNRS